MFSFVSAQFDTYLVPGELTNGKARHVKPPAHGKLTNLPFEHWANEPWTHAFCPDVHAELAERVANCAFSFCASRPFCRVNAALLVC